MEAPPPSYNSAEGLDSNKISPGSKKVSSDAKISPAEITPGAPPAYSAPTAFTIGASGPTKPFVSVPQVKDHLALLHAFAELKLKVAEMTDPGVAHFPADNERRWSWFVGLAVERFEKWCRALEPSHSEKGVATILPPLDVLMVWHAYLLNPGWYAEDGERIEALRGLHQAGEAFTASLASLSRKGGWLGKLLASEPSKQRVDNWVEMTTTPFDPFVATTQLVTREIACPKCRSVVYAPYMTEEGTGYLQQGFKIPCTKTECAFEITREGLAMRKLAKDLAKLATGKAPDYLASVSRLVPWSKLGPIYFSGTLHTPTNPLDLQRGHTIKTAMLSSATLKRPAGSTPKTLISNAAYADFIMEKSQYKMERLKTILAMRMRGQGGRLIGRIMSAYVDDKRVSVELVGAVLRQGSFVIKMYDLGWTKPGFFDSDVDEVALQHAIARYHAFLDLMSSSPASFFVPTLDIDLVWHTHQLMSSNYSKDTTKHVGRFIDHDDKVEEGRLASSFDITCREWKKRYGVPYAHCGCPLPGDTIGQKLSRLVGNSNTNPSYLVPPDRDDLLAATHPSDHNAVFAFHHKKTAEAAQRLRREKIAKRTQRDLERARSGKAVDPLRPRNGQHHPAFLIPIPMYYTPMLAGCAATLGAVVYGEGGAAGGMGSCAAVGVSYVLDLTVADVDIRQGCGRMWGWRRCLRLWYVVRCSHFYFFAERTHIFRRRLWRRWMWCVCHCF
ncbi:hypothetical protein DFH07DRAFT_730681 [Mycena maculata]|uniref:Uncharacterized protein n=1 Tax=Mycena maculata TaxID=230809 RepID=A0AAD7K7H7_9AGAR|nr:hypothetical protein DFH07DRAFT_730681 [Mycena maculata]